MTKLAAVALIALPLAAQEIQNLEGEQNGSPNTNSSIVDALRTRTVRPAMPTSLDRIGRNLRTVGVRVEKDRGTLGLRLSQTALLSATALDALSSRGGWEGNCRVGCGPFRMSDQGAKGLAISGAIVAIEWAVVKKWPQSERFWKWFNWSKAGFHGGQAVHNWRIGE